MPSQQSRNWCFTQKHYDEVAIAYFRSVLKNDQIKYAIFGKKIGESGNPQLQGYVSFFKRQTLGAVRRAIPRAQWELVKGNGKEKYEYYSKEEDFEEFGRYTEQGMKTDLDAAAQTLEEGNINIKETDYESVRKELNDVQVKFKELEQSYKNKEASYKSVVKELIELEQSYKNKEASHDSVVKELIELEQSYKNKEASHDSVVKELDILQDKFDTLEQRCKDTESKLHSVEVKLQQEMEMRRLLENKIKKRPIEKPTKSPVPKKKLTKSPTTSTSPNNLSCDTFEATTSKRKSHITEENDIKLREDQAKQLFLQLDDHQTFDDNPFASQYLIVVEEKKASTICNYRCLLNATKIIVIPRVARDLTTDAASVEMNQIPTYLYLACNLHRKLHFSCSKGVLEQLKNVCSAATFVLCQEDARIRAQDHLKHIIDDVYNSREFQLLRSNFHPEENSFFQKIQHIMTVDFFPEIESFLLCNAKDKRKTVSFNIGFSTTDCKRYVDNRLTIFENIKPFLSGLKLSVKARKLLGKIAILGFKYIVDKGLIQNIPLGNRQNFQQEFAKYLYIHEHDIPYFIAEGITIVLNPLLGPHKDNLNDPNFDTTLTITSMCQSVDSSREDRQSRSKLKGLVGGDMFPFTIIFYSRRVCASYHLLRSKLDQFSEVGEFQAYLIQRILDVDSPSNYYGTLFDSDEYYLDLLTKIGNVKMSRYHDPLSRYSIALDIIFGHAISSENEKCMTVENLLVILLNLVRNSRYSEICANIDQFDFTKMYNTNPSEIKNLFRLVKKTKRFQMNKMHSEWTHLHEKLLESPFHLKEIEASELIHLMALTGIIPLEFCLWSSIRCLPAIVLEDEWSNIIHFVKSHISRIASVDTLKSIAVDYIHQVMKPESEQRYDCEEVFGNIRTWVISKTGRCQNIFRLKKHTSDLMTLCIRTPIIDHKDSKESKHIQLTDWEDKTSSICWIHPNNAKVLALGSKMHVPDHLRKFFHTKCESIMLIMNPIEAIPMNPKSHNLGWAQVWSNQLGVSIDHTCSEKISQADLIYIYHGVNFTPGKLNLFGGATEDLYNRLNRVITCKNVISLDHDMPDYGELLKNRVGLPSTFEKITVEWCTQVSARLKNIRVLRQENLGFQSVTIGDSHSIAFSSGDDMVLRYDGKTLHSALQCGLESFLRDVKPVKNLVLCFGSIDIRHHILRQENFDMADFIKEYVTQGNSIAERYGCNVFYCCPVPVEHESRRIPKTGYYKNTPFYGTTEERRKVTQTFIKELKRQAANRVIQPPEEWYEMDGELYAKTYMELKSSFHIAPPFYRRHNWGESSSNK